MEEHQIPVQSEAEAEVEKVTYAVPWSITDTWLGVALLILLSVGMLTAVFLGYGVDYLDNVGAIFLEAVYIVPVVLILAFKRIHWKHLGFGGFTLNVIGVGCGLLVGGYVIVIAHNAILYFFGIGAQGDQFFEVFSQLDAPIWFFITGAVVAPFVEEIFFRGFLFQGFRQKYGWKTGILLSSFLFAAVHLDPVALVPTFIIGCVLAYIYHRSNSLWPGIIFHASINTVSLTAFYLATKFPELIPS